MAAPNGGGAPRACSNHACVQLRASYQGVCASRGILTRQLERLEARVGIERVRAGGDGRMPAGMVRVEAACDARQRQENLHVLRERLRALRALVQQSSRSEDNEAVVRAMREKADELEQTVPTVLDELLAETVGVVCALRDVASKLAVEVQPMLCGICYGSFERDDAITGKNCYHWFHAGCVAMAAYTRVQPRHRVDDHPYWAFQGYTTHADGSVAPRYALRPSLLEADGETAKGFPRSVWLPCPVCNDPHYANDEYMRLVTQALATLDEPDATDVAAELPAPDQLQKWRDERHVLLIEPPGTAGTVMLVEARVPNRAPPEGFPTYGKAAGVYRQCGFRWDGTGAACGGGNAWHRARRDDDVLDDLRAVGGTLVKTRPTNKRRLVAIEPGPDGQPRFEERRVLDGGGAWKCSYAASSATELEDAGAAI
jgi:hypothetical protein